MTHKWHVGSLVESYEVLMSSCVHNCALGQAPGWLYALSGESCSIADVAACGAS
jgi:hypothetical protein